MIDWLKRERRRGLPLLPEELPPLPLPVVKETLPMPTEYIKPNQDLTEDREIMQRAARLHDASVREREGLKQQLDQALHGLESKNLEIGNLQVQLAEERNRVQSYQAERDDAVDGRINAEARLADIKAILERAELPAPKRRGRKSVGDLTFSRPVTEPSNGGDVPDQAGSQTQVAEPAPVVAHE